MNNVIYIIKSCSRVIKERNSLKTCCVELGRVRRKVYMHAAWLRNTPPVMLLQKTISAIIVALSNIINLTNLTNLVPLTAKLFNLNFHPLEVVSRWRDPQLQGSANYSDLTKWRSTLLKSCWLMSHFIFNIFKMWYLMCNPNICGTGG